MKLTLDLESRSEASLKDCGMFVYSEHPSTDIMCMSLKVDKETPLLWVPVKFLPYIPEYSGLPLIDDETLMSIIDKADTIEAHNYGFEACMWHEIMHKRYDFPDLLLDKAQCSAAKAASHALPRYLEGACEALGLDQEKDKVGYKIMMKWCKPRKPTKHNPSIWHDDPDEFEILCRYCMQDTEAEEALSSRLYNLPASEGKVWKLDQIINKRGVKVDLVGINKLIKKVEEKERSLILEVQEITEGRINSVRQVEATKTWLKEQGIALDNLQKETVEKTLEYKLPPKVERLLKIRQSLGKSSVSKLDSMKAMACKDGRVRGSLLYHGASTGRFAGKGMQPHNYPRESYASSDIVSILDLDSNIIDMVYGCVIQTASKCLRGMLCSDKGNAFYSADFSAIEARVLAWLANEEKTLEAFRSGLDLYKVAAADVYKIKYEDVQKPQRFVGKTVVLSSGYQGWVDAFQRMARTNNVKISDDAAKQTILAWREANPNIVKFWEQIELAALAAVRTKEPYSYGRIKFGIRDNFLHCRLPSGRLLPYYDPQIRSVIDKFGRRKETIAFMGVHSTTKKWVRQITYGGKLTENIVQAISRDILVESMLRVEKAGYKIVFHVHDEIIAEMREWGGDLKQFENIMSVVPDWAEGCPISAKGWVGSRYKKD